MGTTLSVAPHRLLDAGAFVTRFAQPMAQLTAPPQLADLLTSGAAPLSSSETVRSEVRQLLREGGFKPSGRSKPASEYLVAAHAEARFPRINAAVDACNVASLFSGLPISLIDLDRVVGGLEIRVCPPNTTYVFNPSGQVIDASGLLAVFDAEGPTGTPVKDAQRTKTHDDTRTTLAVVWGTNALPGRTEQATRWYRELVAMIPGATNEDVEVRR
ncbi:MAG TPA: phenylalanine--tRNA ligase beta subunit-related protein [Kofleriaceae bacterium]|nr:phenylalanine--tRNA ligase beta subunit-related protein [Kofleriaceae bacterium]